MWHHYISRFPICSATSRITPSVTAASAVANPVERAISEGCAKSIGLTCQQRPHDRCRDRHRWDGTHCSHHKSVKHCLPVWLLQYMRAAQDNVGVYQHALVDAIWPPQHARLITRV